MVGTALLVFQPYSVKAVGLSLGLECTRHVEFNTSSAAAAVKSSSTAISPARPSQSRRNGSNSQSLVPWTDTTRALVPAGSKPSTEPELPKSARVTRLISGHGASVRHVTFDRSGDLIITARYLTTIQKSTRIMRCFKSEVRVCSLHH